MIAFDCFILCNGVMHCFMMCNELHKCMHHARNLPIEAVKTGGYLLSLCGYVVLWGYFVAGKILPEIRAKNEQ
ncbi:putative membrane protein [Klebsiella phage vB_KpnS-VAC112]|uniref:Membrane protein n=2 Tax=Webervirus TaxID=1920860 RepID=A0A9E7NGC9_9CAUD|nr:putative membrane protein [Klebsiella phage vB_KpnS-VAC112]UTN90195.1 putative membrane protein [Klebsiella phage vB_KpnS-VAC111]